MICAKDVDVKIGKRMKVKINGFIACVFWIGCNPAGERREFKIARLVLFISAYG